MATRHTDALAMALHSVAIHLLRAVRGADEASGLTPQRLSAMSVLVFGGAATLGELAAAEHVAPPTMSRLVRALERDGLVARATSTADRRIIHLAATPKGAQLLKQAQRRRLRLVSALLDAMTAAELRAVSAAVPALQRVLSAGVPRATHRQETK